MTYNNEVIKLNEKQSLEQDVYIRFQTVERLVKENKSLIIVNDKDQQCLITCKELFTLGKEIKSELKSIPVHNLSYEFIENCYVLNEGELRWLKRINYSWFNKLRWILTSDDFLDNITYINSQREKVNVFPERENIFEAFKYNYNNIRVVIVGQDPYPQAKSKATGLAFASGGTNNEIKPFALKEIEKEVKQQFNYPANMLMDNNLEYLAKQGVMLLNTSLSVVEGRTGSHAPYWEDFIINVLAELDNHIRPLVIVLLGEKAKSYKKLFNPLIHTIFERSHPTSAYHNQTSWNSNGLFKEINSITQIKWL